MGPEKKPGDKVGCIISRRVLCIISLMSRSLGLVENVDFSLIQEAVNTALLT